MRNKELLAVAGTLGLFGRLFGARNLDFTRQQTGLMTAVAVSRGYARAIVAALREDTVPEGGL